ncbi:MAG: CTP synthase [Parcubacteria group bacterium Athens1014_10]|nr:MAG: CTP synthase [Parcubacteria group bacterium Athens1014_10]TSD04755.1 MAG: CTP synthase [Parcubacteria group bacterium Athens0714_12]
MTKYIFIAGGVMSGIGKGAATASLGKILQSKGFKVTAIKIDPYINVDAGTMNPIEHGEVFVTEDGDETDQDIGNYERFLDENIFSANYMTTGRVYQSVIEKERNLKYQGRCVEVVPHIPEEVINRLKKAAKKAKADFVLTEIGGTVGEYQNVLFLEAARMLRLREPKNVLFILVSYLPIPNKIGEMKTKPTQTAVRTLNSAGLQPDFILCRAKVALDEPRKRKLSIFCNISPENVISAPDIDFIYEIPLNFEKDKLGDKILKKFNLRPRKNKLKEWHNLINTIKSVKKKIKIGVVGKYFTTGNFTLLDSYISVIEAIKHASWFYERTPEIEWISSEDFESFPKKLKKLKKFDGIIVPGGFGSRGVEGKIKAIQYCRENKIPFLGLCFGMQLAAIEFARNVAGLKEANSSEIVPKTKYPIIHLMPEQLKKIQKSHYGGSMRLGAYPCLLLKNSLAGKSYFSKQKTEKPLISERHRHRYEFNNEFKEILEKKGLIISGFSPDKQLVEIIEIKNHPFFMGVQFHPEFKSRPLSPHPLFKSFIKSALN